MKNIKPTIIDLFAGVGGFSLGATRAGFRLALAVELDDHAVAAHKVNFPQSKHLIKDLFLLDGKEILKNAHINYEELDGLIGGPPCQGFSAIGKRSTLDPRNNLFIKFFELVIQCKPKFFIAENVLGILNKQYDHICEKAFSLVDRDYVLLEPMRLIASDFGAPTSRERVFFIGYRADYLTSLSHNDFLSHKVNMQITVANALQGLPLEIDSDTNKTSKGWRLVEELPHSNFWDKVTGNIPEEVGDKESILLLHKKKLVSGCFGTHHSREIQKRYGSLMPGERDKISKSVRLKLNGFCPTIRAGTNKDHGSYQAVRPIHPIMPRVITPREAARLQGFPDWYRFSPAKWHSFRQIGNSVSPILAEKIFDVIIGHLR